jgi:hypothetical protein
MHGQMNWKNARLPLPNAKANYDRVLSAALDVVMGYFRFTTAGIKRGCQMLAWILHATSLTHD